MFDIAFTPSPVPTAVHYGRPQRPQTSRDVGVIIPRLLDHHLAHDARNDFPLFDLPSSLMTTQGGSVGKSRVSVECRGLCRTYVPLPMHCVHIRIHTGRCSHQTVTSWASFVARSILGSLLFEDHARKWPKSSRRRVTPFPELESPENLGSDVILPATLLSGSAPCPRRLTLRDGAPRSATGLVELSLTLEVAYCARPEASFIENLQRMSCLRRLELKLNYCPRETTPNSPPPPAIAGGVVPLSQLTDLVFMGHHGHESRWRRGVVMALLERIYTGNPP